MQSCEKELAEERVMRLAAMAQFVSMLLCNSCSYLGKQEFIICLKNEWIVSVEQILSPHCSGSSDGEEAALLIVHNIVYHRVSLVVIILDSCLWHVVT